MGRPSSTSSLSILLALVLLFLFPHETSFLGAAAAAASPSSSLVEKTCKAAFARQDYDNCVRILNSAPESKSATDARDLVIIAGNLTRANVSETMTAMKELMRNLDFCLGFYGEMKYELGTTMEWIKAGNLSDVKMALDDIERTPDCCDIVLFESIYEKHPYYEEDEAAKSMAGLLIMLFFTISGEPPVNFAPADIAAGNGKLGA